MECEDNKYVRFEAAAVDDSLGVKRKRHAAESDLQLDVTIAMPSASDGKPMLNCTVPPLKNNCQKITPADTPFMNNMDEISYWVHTKRAPCLYTYDQVNIKHKEQAHCSKFKPKNNVLKEVPSPKKRNKRKHMPIDDDTASTEQEPVVNFFTCDSLLKPDKNNGKISSIGSDIKESSTQIKPKRMRLERKSKANLIEKHTNNIASSTPKVGALRRSLRKLQKTLDKSQLESTMENLNNNANFEDLVPENVTQDDFTKPSQNDQKTVANEIIAVNQNCDNVNDKSKHETIHNGQFEDESDVSGFTANYIRSTKIVSNKPTRNIRSKLKRSTLKQTPEKQGSKTVMCVNKSVNTGLVDSSVLNCSTDSSQNIINVVTLKSNEKARVNRATSLLKFMDTKPSDSKESLTNIDIKNLSNVNVSIQSNGTSRYPKRYKNTMADEPAPAPIKTNQTRCAPSRRKKTCKNSSECNNSDRKENPVEEFMTRTRSGRKIGLKVRQADNSVLVLSNSTEQVSSMTAVNVAGPIENNTSDDSTKKTRRSCRGVQLKKSEDTGRQARRKDSLKDKSGFSACFSESDDDIKPVKQGKFFC